MNKFLSTSAIIMGILVQAMVVSLGVLALQFYRVLPGQLMLVATAFIALNYLIGIVFIIRLVQADYQARAFDKQESMLKLIRSQRHDITNHLQTIYGLLQLGKFNQAKRYANELKTNIFNENQVVRLDEPVLAAFLQGKMGQAMAKEVTFKIGVMADLGSCPVKPYFLVTILSNLLDNAFEATEKLPVAHRFVELKINRQGEAIVFTVANSGPDIDVSLRDDIFHSGFSTKGHGRGFGLAHVREIVDNHNGNIEVSNGPTTFTVTLPCKKGVVLNEPAGTKVSDLPAKRIKSGRR